MPVHERLYRRLAAPPPLRGTPAAVAISRYGSRYALKGWFVKFVFLGSFAPVVVISFVLYIVSRHQQEVLQGISQLTGQRLASFADVLPETWYRLGANVIYWVLGVVQGWFALMLTALVGAHQIAADLRSHAFEVYLARPITSWDYLAGKTLVVLRPLFIITALPALLMLAIGNLLLEGSFQACWSLYPRILLGALILSLTNSLVILGISSLSKSSRYATVIWFVVYFLSMVVQQILVQTTQNTGFDLVSYRANQQGVLGGILELEPYGAMDLELPDLDRSAWICTLPLLTLAAGSVLLVLRRLRAGRLP